IPRCSGSRIGIVALYSKPSISSSSDHRMTTWFVCSESGRTGLSIIQPRWKDFVSRPTAELVRYTIFVSFPRPLSVPGVVNPNSSAGPIQIIVYCSVVSTIVSIVFSFALMNVYNNPRLLIARNVLEAMGTLSPTKMDMAGLAITHSLPIALFSVALALQIFGRKEPATVATLSVEVLAIILFMFMGMKVMRLFSQNGDGRDGDASTDKNSHPTGPHQNV
ncbi:hypothetical protein V8E55_008791, partial [Tylopilus felleus]